MIATHVRQLVTRRLREQKGLSRMARARAARAVGKIRRLREEKGLSVTDAAERAELSPVLWLKIEADADEDTPLRTLRTVAAGLGMKLRQLAAELE